ncbi:MAG: EFR1 family ferrodoxin [Lentisphaeria bacterium]|nr:EFR1 family ferrodoxin [Lentisphaeria bacterium]
MHRIYYFSGTGNSYYLAKQFAKNFQKAELLSIAHLDRCEDVILDADVTGIFFPVYCGGVPPTVHKFLKRITLPEGGQKGRFLYAVCTSSGVPGAALPIVEDILAERSIDVKACFHIRMPSNYYPLSGALPEKQIKQIFQRAERALRIAAIMVKKRKKTHPLRVFPIDTFVKFVAGRAIATLANSDKAFRINEKCSSCEMCARICPASNITLDKENHPSWNHHCEQCMACLQWCPEGAIQYGKIDPARKKYHHPEVKAEELARPSED